MLGAGEQAVQARMGPLLSMQGLFRHSSTCKHRQPRFEMEGRECLGRCLRLCDGLQFFPARCVLLEGFLLDADIFYVVFRFLRSNELQWQYVRVADGVHSLHGHR